MNDRKDSIKEKIGVIGKIYMNQLTEKDLKVQKRTISLLLTLKKKRKKNNFKRFNEGKKYKVLHLTDNKKKNNDLSSKEMNNDPKRTQEEMKKEVMERSMRTYWPKKDLKLPKRTTTDSKEEEKGMQKKGRQKVLHLTYNEK